VPSESRCIAVTDGGAPCGEPCDEAAPVGLCALHSLAVYEWVARGVGVTDVLPSPCLACGSRLGVRYPSGWLCAICEWRVGEVPDGEAAPPRVDVVYYIRYRERVKIGTSANPRQRLSALVHEELLAFERGDRRLEQRRHAEFHHLRVGTSEWFRAGEDLLEHARNVRGGADPWSSYALWVSAEIARR
jgi:hypothetical protein